MAAFGRAQISKWLLIVVLGTAMTSVAANDVCASWVSDKSCNFANFADPQLVVDLGPAMDAEHCRQLCSQYSLKSLVSGCCTGNPSLYNRLSESLDPLQKPCTFAPGQVAFEDRVGYQALECGNQAALTCSFEDPIAGGRYCSVWRDATVADFDWTRQQKSTPTFGTGPSSAYDGQYYLFIESSAPQLEHDEAILRSYEVLLSAGARLTFHYHMWTEDSSMGNLHVEIHTSTVVGSIVWTSEDPGNNPNVNKWLSADIDLGAYVGSVVVLSFHGVVGNGYRGDIAIDKLVLRAAVMTTTTTATSTTSATSTSILTTQTSISSSTASTMTTSSSITSTSTASTTTQSATTQTTPTTLTTTTLTTSTLSTSTGTQTTTTWSFTTLTTSTSSSSTGTQTTTSSTTSTHSLPPTTITSTSKTSTTLTSTTFTSSSFSNTSTTTTLTQTTSTTTSGTNTSTSTQTTTATLTTATHTTQTTSATSHTSVSTTTPTTSSSTVTSSTNTSSTVSTSSSTASTITTTTTISTVSNTSTTSTSTSSTNTSTTTQTTATSTVTTSTVTSTAAPTGDQVLVVLQQAETSTAAALSASNKTSITTVQAGATISVHKINVSEVASSGGSVNVSVPGSNVSVSLPASVLQAVGVKDAMLSVTSYGNASTAVASSAKALPAGSTLASEPVSVRILISNGSQDVNFTHRFSQPVAIRLMSSRPPGANCAFWDEVEKRWSNRDVTTRVASDGSMICDTLHLTLFAAIVSEFSNVLKCSNAKVMTGEGLKAIGRGDWWMSASAMFLWGVMVAQIIVLGTTLAHDRRNAKRQVWKDEDFLTVNEAYETESVSCAKLQEMFKCCRKKKEEGDEPTASEASELEKDQKSGVVKAVEKATVSVMQGTAVKAVAWHQQLHPEDLRDLIKGVIEAKKKDDEESLEQGHKMQSAPIDFAPLAVSASDRAFMAFQRFRTSPFFLNAAVFFAALHPWLNLGQFSISMSAFIRALLLTAKLLGALMISAMFFDGTGMAKSKDSVCTVQGFWAVLWRNVAISIFSALLSTIPLLFIRFLRSRRFVYRTSWDDKKAMQKYLVRWRLEDVLVVVLGITYCLLCDLFIMAFLANISRDSEWDWLTSAVIVVIKEMVVMPVLMAVVFAAFVTLVARKRPDLITQVGQNAGFLGEAHLLRRMTHGLEVQAWSTESIQMPQSKLPTIMDLNLAKEALGEKAPVPLVIDDEAMHKKAILDALKAVPRKSHVEPSMSVKNRILVEVVFAAWAAHIGDRYIVQMYPSLPGSMSPEFYY